MIRLVGNLVCDTVSYECNTKSDFGGIASVAKSIKDCSEYLRVSLCPTSLGKANIYINKDARSKYVNFVDLNWIELEVAEISTECKWEHISYLNKIEKYIPVKKNQIVSADLCAGELPTKELLNLVDILFLSTDEFPKEEQMRFLQDNSKIIISHSPEEIKVFDRQRCLFVLSNNDIIEKCNILGAGDYFCGQFIGIMSVCWFSRHLFTDENVLKMCAEYARNKTISFLKEREKI